MKLKTFLPALAIAGTVMLAAAGCGNQDEDTQQDTGRQQAEETESENSVLKEVVGTVTGAKQIEKGEEAKDQIRQLQDERQKRIEEALDME